MQHDVNVTFCCFSEDVVQVYAAKKNVYKVLRERESVSGQCRVA